MGVVIKYVLFRLNKTDLPTNLKRKKSFIKVISTNV